MQNTQEEMPLDIKTDIKIAFDFMKGEKNTINKLKLRTLLFSFAMYKYSAKDINEYIDEQLLEMGMDQNKENFTFDEVCDLINQRLDNARERESDELFNYIAKKKDESSKITRGDLSRIFKTYELGIGDEELDKMMDYMTKKNDSEHDEFYVEENDDEEDMKKDDKNKNAKSVTRSQFKKFYTETK